MAPLRSALILGAVLVGLGCGARTGLELPGGAPDWTAPRPPACTTPRWGSCRPLFEPVELASATAGTAWASFGWTGTVWVGAYGAGDEQGLIRLTPDGEELSRESPPVAPTRIVFHPDFGVGLLAGRGKLAWLDYDGRVVAQRDLLAPGTQVGVYPSGLVSIDGGFLLIGRTSPDEGLALGSAHVGRSPEDVHFEELGIEAEPFSSPRFAVDERGLAHWLAFSEGPFGQVWSVREDELVPSDWSDATPPPDNWPDVLASLVEDEGRLLLLHSLRLRNDSTSIQWILELDGGHPARWWELGATQDETDGDPLFRLGSDLLIAETFLTRNGPYDPLRIGRLSLQGDRATFEDEIVVGQSELRDPQVGSSSPILTRTPEGFGISWTEQQDGPPWNRAAFFQAFDCCDS